MSASERLVEVLIAIEIEAAEFYEALARRPGERPELRALWVDLAEDERQHVNWLRRLGGGALASERLTEVAAPSLEAALADVRRHRQRLEHGGASDTDALAVAVALETSEASRALADLVSALSTRGHPFPSTHTQATHLERLAWAAEQFARPELARSVRGLLAWAGSGPVSRRTILVVDDDPDILETCARILQPSGHDCLTATHGAQALQVVRSRRLDLIVADLKMPDMDGLTLLANAHRFAPQIPVVIFTAYASAESARQARAAGAAAYLAKPFSVDQLREVVNRVLAERPRAAPPSPTTESSWGPE